MRTRKASALPVSAASVVTALCLVLAACSSSNNDSSASGADRPGVESGNGGLRLAEADSRRLSFVTNVQQDVTVGEETQSQSVNTVVVRDVSLSANGDTFVIETLPELESFTPEALRPPAIILERTRREYTELGERLAGEEQDTLQDALSLDSFSVPALTFSHPGTALDVGSQWLDQDTTGTVASSVRSSVTELTASVIAINHSIESADDSRDRFVISGSMNARYSLPSLLLVQADVDISVRFEDDLYVNGVLQAVVDSTRVTQTITEVSR